MPKQGETIETHQDNDKESSIRPKLDDILEDDHCPLIASPAQQQAVDMTKSDITQVEVVVNVQKLDQKSSNQASSKLLKDNKKS